MRSEDTWDLRDLFHNMIQPSEYDSESNEVSMDSEDEEDKEEEEKVV